MELETELDTMFQVHAQLETDELETDQLETEGSSGFNLKQKVQTVSISSSGVFLFRVLMFQVLFHVPRPNVFVQRDKIGIYLEEIRS